MENHARLASWTQQLAIKAAAEAIAAQIGVNGLQVDIGGSITVPMDLIDVDVYAITGTPPSNATLFDLETLLTAANVDHAASEVLLTSLETLLTASNVDLAAMEVLLTTMDADTGAIKTATEKGGLGESTTLSFAEFSNANAMVPGTSVDALAIGGDAPFITASIQAQKLVAGATQPPVPNVGDVWICSAAEQLAGAKKLSPGQSMELHPNGNLNEYFCGVVNANDGLSITYTA